MSTYATQGLILFAHGARDPLWAQPFHRLREIVSARAPDIPTELAFLEHMRPDLVAAIGLLADRGVERITVAPLFMARGGHLRRDLPQIIAQACQAHPGVLIRATEAIGEVDSLLNAIVDWVLQEHEATGRADLGNPIA